MPFKVVQTIQKGKIVLAYVPQQRECNGKLYWSKKYKHLKKLQKDEHSQPDQTWNQFECVVKRKNKGSDINFNCRFNASYSDILPIFLKELELSEDNKLLHGTTEPSPSIQLFTLDSVGLLSNSGVLSFFTCSSLLITFLLSHRFF